MDNAQLEQLVGKKVELYDPRTKQSLTGVVLYRPPQEQRCEYVLVYREKDEFKYKLLPAHLLSLMEETNNSLRLQGDITEQVSWYDNGYRTLVLGLKALFKEAGMPIS